MLRRIRNLVYYEVGLATLATINTVLFIYEISGQASVSQVNIIQKLDLLVAIVFLFDFLIAILLSDSKLRYFRQNWLNLLSSVPITDNIYRSLRILRVFRAVRLLRTSNALSNTHRIKKFIDKRKKSGN